MVDPAEALAAAVGGAGIRVVRQGAVNAGALHQQLRHAPDLTASAGEGDAVFGNIGHQLRAGLLQHSEHLVGNLPGRAAQHLVDFRGGQGDHLRHTGLEVTALDVHAQLLVPGEHLTDLDFDALRSDLANDHAVLTADIPDDRIVKGIPRHLQ